ncbi:DUF3558 domain-containing protein [Pseudonocardia bannensis]
MAVAGCTVPSEGRASPAPAAAAVSSQEPLIVAPKVVEPKDARSIAACDLLTPAQLTSLDLLPNTARPDTSGGARTCGWKSAKDANLAGVTIATDLAIGGLEGLYLTRDTFEVFEPGDVGGHPSVRADGNRGGRCSLYVAVAEDQLLSTDGNLAGRPASDPCAVSRRMAELVLANLPHLR